MSDSPAPGPHGKTVLDALRPLTRELRHAIPDVYAGFAQFHGATFGAGALDTKTKELIALAIGVSARCDGCIGFHVKALIRLGVTREQLMETLGICTYMGGGPSLMYAAEAVRAYDEFTARTAKPA